jgi:hypothetical protein
MIRSVRWTLAPLSVAIVIAGCSDRDDTMGETEVRETDPPSTGHPTSEPTGGASSVGPEDADGTRGDTEDSDGSGDDPEECVSAPHEPAADWYVAPTGSPDAAGTLVDPLDLATVLSAMGPVEPGQHVMLLEGTYLGRFISEAAGAPDQAIVYFADPAARVTIDADTPGTGSALSLEAPWVEVHGLEITTSDDVRVSTEPGSSDITLASGVTITAANVKLVNNVIHDVAQGVSFWSNAIDGELYGNIIYNNGWLGTDRGHGHAIYTQNATGTKHIVRNVIFFGFGFGVHAYTEGGSIQGFDIVENVWFRTGASVPGQTGYSDGCLVGGLQPVARARLIANASFAPAVQARGVQLGWGGSVQNDDITLIDNFLVGRLSFNGHWHEGTLEGNVLHSELSGVEPELFPDNTYADTLPQGQQVIVRENAYDPSRAELVLYDWEETGSVAVDLEGVVPVGASFRVYSVFDLWGDPVVDEVYEGGAVEVALGTKSAPDPQGLAGAIEGQDDPGPAFGVFVVRHELCAER